MDFYLIDKRQHKKLYFYPSRHQLLYDFRTLKKMKNRFLYFILEKIDL